jgi:hypothetical protein
MNKLNKKTDKSFKDKEHRGAKIAYNQAKIRAFVKDRELEKWMDMDNDFVLGNTRPIHKTDIRY